ncbi:hypothetical protein E2C01_037150 [Portunus trituberculatus]|uniref:Uncharacterized protein n=1 Tax=Portunus trituberculatus TaxID=210409 RepID=A0A5B7F8K8_PORTR|nr:hypothetical protein [Portunus trituberculatus]
MYLCLTSADTHTMTDCFLVLVMPLSFTTTHHIIVYSTPLCQHTPTQHISSSPVTTLTTLTGKSQHHHLCITPVCYSNHITTPILIISLYSMLCCLSITTGAPHTEMSPNNLVLSNGVALNVTCMME